MFSLSIQDKKCTIVQETGENRDEVENREEVLLSVIIPVYNAKEYLPHAVEDILNQTCPDWELLLVDDASSDGSLEMVREFEKKDDRIRLICHEKNKGVSAARNTGIANARGEYLLFMDADDRYEPTLLEEVNHGIQNAPADVVLFGFWEEYIRGEKTVYQKEFVATEGYYSDPHEIHKLVPDLNRRTMYGYPWNKAYRTGLVKENHFVFGADSFGEDILFNIEVFDAVTFLSVIAKPLYHYINRSEKKRLTGRYIQNYMHCQKKRIGGLLAQQKRWNTLDEATYGYLSEEYFRSFFSMMEREYAHHTSKEEIIEMAEKESADDLFARMAEHLPQTLGRAKTFMFLPLKEKDFKCAYDRMRAVSFVRRHMGGLFARLKQDR